ncbi:MAG: helix-turn-helix domain-containing protein [Hyphomicrobiales bacterium]|nr:helix-turn-helix domain-containing protein [Hyphomicrobiales bacterium]
MSDTDTNDENHQLRIMSFDHLPSDISQTFAVTFNNFYVEMSRIVTERFHGDLHMFLVLVALSNNSIAPLLSAADRFDRYGSLDHVIAEDYAYTKLLTLAQIVGLPRTTVRRKVQALMALGYIEHDPRKGFRLIKRRMAESPTIRDILDQQYALMVKLVGVLSRRGILRERPGGARAKR